MTEVKTQKQVVELLYNSFTKVPDPDLVVDNIYIKSSDEYIPVAQVYDEELSFIIDRIKQFNKTKIKFTMVYQDTMYRMAKELSGGSIRVLLYLLSKVHYHNCVYGIKYNDISTNLDGMSYSTIVSAFNELKEKGYIKETGKRTNLVYHISPGVCWRGSVSSMYGKLKMFVE